MSKQELIPINEMGWSERLAITTGMDLSDEDTAKYVCEVLNIPLADLQATVGLAASGEVEVNEEINPKDYINLFDMSRVKLVKAQTSSPATKPAQKTAKAPSGKKRGRQGVNIASAFAAIPHTPTPVNEFKTRFNVSSHVLRQQKRFDPTPELGRVRVKTDSETKQLVIYRDQPTAE